MKQQLRHWRHTVTERIGVLGTVAAIFAILGLVILILAYAVSLFRGAVLFQVLGAAILGAGLSALVGTFAGREAIQHQSAKEANLDRKRNTYGPLYAELKALRVAFSEAEAGAASAPQWVDNGDVVKRAGVVFLSPLQSVPTLKCWPEFRRDYRDTDFTPAAQVLLDEVQACATTYNNAVEAARELATRTLGNHIEDAINRIQQSADYKRWHEKQAEQKSVSVPVGHEPKTEQDWYGYIEYVVTLVSSLQEITPGQQLAEQWLGRWPDPIPSQLLGWILATPTDQEHKAADYVWSNYPTHGMSNSPPPSDWIDGIFVEAWPALRRATETRQAMDAGAALLERVRVAEQRLATGLSRIQERYEGGEPLV